jgi:hypothetical protein
MRTEAALPPVIAALESFLSIRESAAVTSDGTARLSGSTLKQSRKAHKVSADSDASAFGYSLMNRCYARRFWRENALGRLFVVSLETHLARVRCQLVRSTSARSRYQATVARSPSSKAMRG